MSDSDQGDKRAAIQERAQVELNRQALVSLGRRLVEIENQMSLTDLEISELQDHADSSLATAQRLRVLVEKLAGLKRDSKS